MNSSDLQDKYQSTQLNLAHLNQLVGELSVELENLQSKLLKTTNKSRVLKEKNKILAENILELEEKLLEAEQEILTAQLAIESKENLIHLLTESRSFKIGKIITNFIKSIPGFSLIKSLK